MRVTATRRATPDVSLAAFSSETTRVPWWTTYPSSSIEKEPRLALTAVVAA
jgi:hypothetical protein